MPYKRLPPESRLLRITRQLLPLEHQQLRSHMPEINRLGDLSIKWRRLGEAAVTLLERGEYEQAIRKQAARLALQDTVALAETLNTTMLPMMPDGNRRLTIPIVDIRFLGKGRFQSIAYMLDEKSYPDTERPYVTTTIDRLSGVASDWGTFEPHVSVATIPAVHAEDAILDEFWRFAPEQATLLPAKATSI